MNHRLEEVLSKGVLTGSRAFNCAKPDSDYDIVIIKSHVPNYKIWDWQEHEILNGSYLSGCDEAQSDVDDEGYYEYDKVSIWGPITKIVKYWYPLDEGDDDSEWIAINLFIYPDQYLPLYNKFKQLNILMNLTQGDKLKDKDYRIEKFIEIIDKVGIANA